jgi:hypothetical protein
MGALAISGPARVALAQKIELQGGPIEISVLEGRPLKPITSVSMNDQGDILVIGGPTRHELFLMDATGAVRAPVVDITALGAPLGMPAAVAFETPTTVTVMDGQTARWARLKVKSGRWVMDTVSSAPLARISSICVANRARYVMARVAARDGGIVHLLAEDGALKASFGKPFSDIDNPAVGYGHVSCSRDALNIAALSRLHPEVRSYDGTGRELWTMMLPTFRAVGFRVDGRRILFAYPPDSVWDEVVSLLRPADSVLAVQILRRRGHPASPRVVHLRTVYLAARDGSVLGSQLGLPLIHSATPTRLVGRAGVAGDAIQVYHYKYRPQ